MLKRKTEGDTRKRETRCQRRRGGHASRSHSGLKYASRPPDAEGRGIHITFDAYAYVGDARNHDAFPVSTPVHSIMVPVIVYVCVDERFGPCVISRSSSNIG